jgi:hypothetical protein
MDIRLSRMRATNWSCSYWARSLRHVVKSSSSWLAASAARQLGRCTMTFITPTSDGHESFHCGQLSFLTCRRPRWCRPFDDPREIGQGSGAARPFLRNGWRRPGRYRTSARVKSSIQEIALAQIVSMSPLSLRPSGCLALGSSAFKCEIPHRFSDKMCALQWAPCWPSSAIANSGALTVGGVLPTE